MALATVTLTDAGWTKGPEGWREPFLPEREGSWGEFTALDDLFDYNGSGVMPGRTWVIAADTASLAARWTALINEADAERKEILFHPQLRGGSVASRHIRKVVEQTIAGSPKRTRPVIQETGQFVGAIQYPFRTLDRQWIIQDARLINDIRPQLWESYSKRQIFLTAPDDQPATSGPAVSLCALVPDLHHYNGRAVASSRSGETPPPHCRTLRLICFSGSKLSTAPR